MTLDDRTVVATSCGGTVAVAKGSLVVGVAVLIVCRCGNTSCQAFEETGLAARNAFPVAVTLLGTRGYQIALRIVLQPRTTNHHFHKVPSSFSIALRIAFNSFSDALSSKA